MVKHLLSAWRQGREFRRRISRSIATDIRRLRSEQGSVNVSAAHLNSTHNDFPARVHIESHNKVVAGLGGDQRVRRKGSTNDRRAVFDG